MFMAFDKNGAIDFVTLEQITKPTGSTAQPTMKHEKVETGIERCPWPTVNMFVVLDLCCPVFDFPQGFQPPTTASADPES